MNLQYGTRIPRKYQQIEMVQRRETRFVNNQYGQATNVTKLFKQLDVKNAERKESTSKCRHVLQNNSS